MAKNYVVLDVSSARGKNPCVSGLLGVAGELGL